MMRFLTLTVVAALLSGCSYNLMLMERNSSRTGTGKATRPGNDVTIQADGVTYVGKFSYQEGGFVGTGMGFSGGATASGMMVGASGQGAGNIIARSTDGRGIRCQFTYSGWSSSGMGVCQDDNNKLYDLQIN